MDCGWLLIYNRLKEKGRLEEFKKIMEPKNWNLASMGIPGRVLREDLQLVDDSDA